MDGSWFDWFKVLGPVLLTQGLGFFVAIYLFKRNEDQKNKREILSTLMASRHLRASNEFVSAVNKIDIIFHSDVVVRNSAQKYIAALSDEGFGTPSGQFVANEARIDLVMSIVVHMGLGGKITRADVMRAYEPRVVSLRNDVEWMELNLKQKNLEKELSKKDHE